MPEMRAQVAEVKRDYLAILDEAWQQHLAPRDPDAPTVISLFAGGGGSSLGYSMAGYRELLAVEWDNNAVETFKLNFPDVSVWHGDIAKLSVDECLELTGLRPGELDVLDGSPPCQGFSTAGKRVMDDPRNQLFREYVRLLRGLRPKVFVMENVSGMVKGKMKLVFAEIMRELKASGYRVKAALMNAMYFDVPQSRQRMIFIGVRDDLNIEPSHPGAQGKPLCVKDAIPRAISVSGNRSYRPVWKDASANPSPTINKSVGNEKHGMIEIQILPEMELQDNRLTRLYDQIEPGESAESVLVKGRNFNNMRKPDPEAPMFSIPKEVTNRGAFSVVHWSEKRLLSIPELKRLASFPDEFQLIGKFVEQWARIGNSVPPLFMRAIALHIRGTILDRLAEPIAVAADE